MKVEKWIYKDKEIEIPIFEDNEIEQNEVFDDIDSTIDLSDTLKEVGEENE